MAQSAARRTVAAMFTKIVVGVDGRPSGEDALALAHTLSDAGTERILVNAYPVNAHPGEATELLDRAAGVSGDPRRAVADSSPARALQQAAEREHADLIVVGSCHYRRIMRVVLGDVSRAVLHGAPCPVAVAPRGWREKPPRLARIGVGFTRTPEARAALELATALARGCDGTLRLRTSVSTPVAPTPTYAYTCDWSAYDWNSMDEEHRTLAQEDLDEAVAGLGVRATTEITGGAAAGDLIQLSGEVDLLVVGSRGWGTGRRVVLGSTSDR